MQLTYEQRSEQGAFYTPDDFARLSAERVLQLFPKEAGFLYYDPACGEGNLLQALYDVADYPLIAEGTTLYEEDANICRARGILCEQFDFLNGRMSDLPETIRDAAQESRLVVFTNPPFMRIPANQRCIARDRYRNNDATTLFIQRCFEELHPLAVCTWSKLDIYQSVSLAWFRQRYGIFERTIGNPMLTRSKDWGLKGDFPIVFTILANFYPSFC
ncbi:MAG: N-6 DNA methylase [Paludibacteraceae bacterium]